MVKEAVAIHHNYAVQALKRSVAVTERELPIRYDKESPFGNLLAQSVRRFTGSEIALVNSGQLLAALPKGEITEGLLHSICPSPINPCRVQLLGEHILQALEESLLPEMYDKSISGFGFRGKVLGGICVDGMNVQYDPERAPFKRVIKADIQGIPILPEIVYDVGTLDMFTFGIGYKSLSLGTERNFLLPEFIRDLLRQELQTADAFESCFESRWHRIFN